MHEYSIESPNLQDGAAVSTHLDHRLRRFLQPLLVELDRTLDKRLVQTLYATVQAIIRLRQRAHGLLLSELGGYLLAPDHAPAGTKRLSNLLRSPKWTHRRIDQFLWHQAEMRVADLQRSHTTPPLVVWDESVLEKPESLTVEGLCAVRSSKAARLKRIKPGFYNPPSGRPIFVPGLHWLGLLVLGLQGAPTVAAMRWWTTRGAHASDKRTEEAHMLTECARAWGQSVWHIWDRGFAGSPWLGQAFAADVRFVLRWPKGYKLADSTGESRKAWQFTRGKRSWASGEVWDAHRHTVRRVGILAVPVRHPDYPYPLWLVVARPGKGHEPWYLLTTEFIFTPKHAWQIVYAYSRRWQIETAWRYSKSELAFESPRVWAWDNRLKLLLLATLAYAFLLTLLDDAGADLRVAILRMGCHRTGKRCRTATAPLYRLRAALAYLWQTFRPSVFIISPPKNSG